MYTQSREVYTEKHPSLALVHPLSHSYNHLKQRKKPTYINNSDDNDYDNDDEDDNDYDDDNDDDEDR